MRRVFLLFVLFALSAVGLRAADFNGKWSAEFDTQIGMQKYTYEFHVAGAVVTGKAISERGETAIAEGKVDGDTITFTEPLNFNGTELKIVYTGKLTGDQIRFTRQVGEFATEELTAQRVK